MSGPDQVIEASDYVAIEPDQPVKLRMEKTGMASIKPVSVPRLLENAASKAPDHPALTVKRGDNWLTWTYGEYIKDVRTISKAFIKLGLKPHHSVAIIGFNAPEWFISDLGAVFANGIAAGIYPTNSPEACKFIAQNCRANIIVVEDDKQLQKILEIRNDLPDLKAIVQYLGKPKAEGVLSWNELMEIGVKESNDELENRLKNIAINRCCHLVYTSGTTGTPKGVMLSHDNLTFTAKVLKDNFELIDKEERLVSYLPLSHVAANIMDIFLTISSAGTLYFADKNALKGTLTQTLQAAQPTIFFGVPRVWEKIQEKMLAIGKQNKGLKQQIGTWAKKTGLEHNKNVLNGNARVSLSYKIANKVVFQKVKSALGLNKCKRFFVAAAPMSVDTIEYFLSLDIRIWEMYGMSECTGPQTSNMRDNHRVGTVGQTLPGFFTKLIKVDSEAIKVNKSSANCKSKGELCVRGRNTMMGYIFNQTKTKETFDSDGWLHSGDIAEESDDEYFTITGRIKELIITAGGENIPPVPIEDIIKRELPCLSNVMLIGDRKKFLSCLLTFKVDIDQDSLIPQRTLAPGAMEWCQEVGSKSTTVDDIIDGTDQVVMKAIQEGIERANQQATSNAQRVQKWVIIPEDFSVPGGELGPTLKMKRHMILEKYNSKVEGFYH